MARIPISSSYLSTISFLPDIIGGAQKALIATLSNVFLISQKEEEKRIVRESETKAQQQDRIVYVANHGNAKVYWYSKDRMPLKTNKANVVEMTEADAIAAGKRLSKKE